MTGMTDKQVQRIIKELEPDGVKITGRGARTKYILNKVNYSGQCGQKYGQKGRGKRRRVETFNLQGV